MARFNEILAGRYNRYLQKLFQLKGGPPAAQLASEVMPVYPFFAGRENRFLEGWSTFGHTRVIVAVAAVQGGMRIRNPVNSNLIAIFEKILVGGGLADSPLLELAATVGDMINPFSVIPTRWDARQGQNSSALIFSDSGAAGPGTGLQAKMQAFYPAASSYDFINTDVAELPLLPGDAIEVQSGNVNQQFAVSWLWRERQLEDSELKI